MAENESLDLGGAYARRYGHGWARWLTPQELHGRQNQGVTYASA